MESGYKSLKPSIRGGIIRRHQVME